MCVCVCVSESCLPDLVHSFVFVSGGPVMAIASMTSSCRGGSTHLNLRTQYSARPDEAQYASSKNSLETPRNTIKQTIQNPIKALQQGAGGPPVIKLYSPAKPYLEVHE